jgi:gamma-glutamyltranspeptidase/glutathione hydrolase
VTPTTWRARAGTRFETEKRPVTAARGMVVTNHPLASAAGAEMLAAGGNAVDAAVAALFALSVVEPMMVGIFGAGHAHLLLADGRHTALDGYTTAPGAARPDMYRPLADTWPDYMEAVDRENSVGWRSVGVPGTLAGWCEMLARFGTLEPRRGDGAGDPPRRARVHGDGLSRRVPGRDGRRPRALPGDRGGVHARRRPAAPG